MKPRLLIFSSRTAHNAPRIIREVNALAPVFEIYLTGSTPLKQDNVQENIHEDNHIPFFDRLVHYALRKVTRGRPLTWAFPFSLKRRARLVDRIRPDIIIIHEPENMPYFTKLRDKYKFKLVFNAHEYYPLEFEDKPGWLESAGKYYVNLYRKYLHRLDLLINVCDTIAKECERYFGIPSLVIPNAALFRENIAPIVTDTKGPIRIIQHGACIRERNIELMIETAQLLGNSYVLDLMLMKSDPEYYGELCQLAEKTENVRLIEPVSFNEIVPFINRYDIGLYYIKPGNFNNRAALPNKLFEFIQARLCTVVSPSVEMKNVVESYNLGLAADDFTAEAMALAVRRLTIQDINYYKQNADKNAYRLSADFLSGMLLERMTALLKP